MCNVHATDCDTLMFATWEPWCNVLVEDGSCHNTVYITYVAHQPVVFAVDILLNLNQSKRPQSSMCMKVPYVSPAHVYKLCDL